MANGVLKQVCSVFSILHVSSISLHGSVTNPSLVVMICGIVRIICLLDLLYFSANQQPNKSVKKCLLLLLTHFRQTFNKVNAVINKPSESNSMHKKKTRFPVIWCNISRIIFPYKDKEYLLAQRNLS